MTRRPSEYRWPDEPYRTVRVCCTDHGQHRPENFGRAKVWPDGTVDFVPTTRADAAIGSGRPPLNDDGSIRGPAHVALHCPQCRRHPRLHPRTMRQALIGISAAGGDQLDVSLLPF